MDGNHLILHSPVGFVVAFGGGILSFLSPCVLPLVPAYLSMMSGVSSAELAVTTRPNQRRLLRSTLLFVAGFTAVFAALEATASGLGQALQSHQRLLNQIAGIVIICAGLVFAGLLRPAWLMRERRWHVAPSRLGEWAAPVMGMAFAFAWTPCIGPVLGVVLGLASRTGTLAGGVVLLFAYSLGLALPFVLVGLAFGRMTGALARARHWVWAVELVAGVLLIGFGVLLLTDNVGWVSNHISSWLSDIGLGRLSRS